MAMMKGDLLDRVVQTINRYSMLGDGERVAIAVSGGADSVFLAHALKAIFADRKLTLFVLHVNHHLRGEESEADESFVENLAAQLDLPFSALNGEVGPGNLEQSARDVRRKRLAEGRTRLGLDKVALGHTRTDQAETVLFRLLRGSGSLGLASIAPVRQWLIRPLLDIGRDEIRAFLQSAAIPFRDDSSNQDRRFVRNRLRLTTIPALARAYNPRLEEALAGTAELFRTEEDYWAGEIEDLYGAVEAQTGLGLTIDLKPLATCHVAVKRRLVRRAIFGAKGSLKSIDRRHIEAVLDIIGSRHGHDRVNIPGLDVLRSFDHLLFALPGALNKPRDYRVKLELGTASILPFGAGLLHLTAGKKPCSICVTVEGGPRCKGEEAFLDGSVIRLAAATGDLAVRNWQPGDKLQRVGQGAPEKVKTLFQEHKVFLWCRRHWPVVVAGNEIVWVRGFGPAQRFAGPLDSPHNVRVCFEAGK